MVVSRRWGARRCIFTPRAGCPRVVATSRRQFASWCVWSSSAYIPARQRARMLRAGFGRLSALSGNRDVSKTEGRDGRVDALHTWLALLSSRAGVAGEVRCTAFALPGRPHSDSNSKYFIVEGREALGTHFTPGWRRPPRETASRV
jgi:hypothetical protein